MKKIALVKWILDDSGGGERVAISLANELTKSMKFISIGIDNKDNRDLFFKNQFSGKISNFFDHRVRLS